jgi:ATP-binding cassette, subfamily B, bacterial
VFRTLRGLSVPGAHSGTARITVLVSHRPADVKHADQILVLEHGRLVEHGRRERLTAWGGTHHELFTLRARAYADDGGAPDTVPA